MPYLFKICFRPKRLNLFLPSGDSGRVRWVGGRRWVECTRGAGRGRPWVQPGRQAREGWLSPLCPHASPSLLPSPVLRTYRRLKDLCAVTAAALCGAAPALPVALACCRADGHAPNRCACRDGWFAGVAGSLGCAAWVGRDGSGGEPLECFQRALVRSLALSLPFCPPARLRGGSVF